MALTSATVIFICLFKFCLFLSAARAVVNKHVVFMHGILAGPEEWDRFEGLVQKHYPGMPVTKVSAYDHGGSLEPMGTQAVNITGILKPILTNSSSSTVLVCYSQGGLICRGVLSMYKHNVETFISLSSPQAGQFGDTDYFKYMFPFSLRNNLYKILYTKGGQGISLGGYWNDPHHQDEYRKCSEYLAVLNNVTDTVNPRSHEFKSNFLRLKNLVLVGGPDDGVITPWQSSQFAFFNASEQVLPMFDQSWYKNDAFGLKTLYERKAITVHTMPKIVHHHWHMDDTVFDKTILPFLS